MRAWRLRHVIAVIAGAICFAVVYVYTGDSDLLVAVASGLAMAAISYPAAYLSLALRR